MATSAKKKKIQKMEQQDAEGISRKKWKHTLNPNVFIVIKTVLIALIPIFYFVYSPVLIFLMIAYIGLFFLARMAEHSMNKSVIKANHIKIFKFDSAIALLVVMVSVFGVCLSTTNKTKSSTFGNMNETEISEFASKGDFKGAKQNSTWTSIKSSLLNLSTLLTGERNVFSSESSFEFGTKDAPKDFVRDDAEFELDSDEIDWDTVNEEFEKRGGNMGKMGSQSFSIDDLPIEYMSSSILSTVNTIMIFSVSVVGAFSLIAIIFQKRKFNREMNEVIVDSSLEMFDDAELDRILSFGEDVEEISLSEKEIKKKIKETQAKDKLEETNGFEEEVIETTEIDILSMEEPEGYAEEYDETAEIETTKKHKKKN